MRDIYSTILTIGCCITCSLAQRGFDSGFNRQFEGLTNFDTTARSGNTGFQDRSFTSDPFSGPSNTREASPPVFGRIGSFETSGSIGSFNTDQFSRVSSSNTGSTNNGEVGVNRFGRFDSFSGPADNRQRQVGLGSGSGDINSGRGFGIGGTSDDPAFELMRRGPGDGVNGRQPRRRRRCHGPSGLCRRARRAGFICSGPFEDFISIHSCLCRCRRSGAIERSPF